MIRRTSLSLLLGLLASSAPTGQTPTTPKYTITDLGTLGGPTSFGLAINAAGQVTGYSSTTDGNSHAFRSDGTTMTDLGTLGGTYSQGLAINAAGQVTGFASLAGDEFYHAFRSDGATMTDLGALGTLLAGSYSRGNAINVAGQVTGWASRAFGDHVENHAFRSDGTTMTDLGTLGGISSQGNAINAAGQVTGQAALPEAELPYHAFRSDGTTMTDLGTLGGTYSEGLAINAAGLVTGWSYLPVGTGFSHAFRSDGATMTDLGTLGGTVSAGYAINAAGQVTGFATLAGDSAMHAFLSDGATMTDLGTVGPAISSASVGLAINGVGQVTGWAQPAGENATHAIVFIPGRGMFDLNDVIPSGSGWTLLEQGTAINDQGQITGWGTINGQEHAFLLTPVPTTTYTFTGFFRPIDNVPTVNPVKAGAAVPVKFSLGGDHGLQIFATGYPKSQQMICGAGLTDDIEQTVTKGGSTLRYDATAGQYIYIWATDKQWEGTCRQLQVGLADGQVFTANFQFR